jgi:hypothetical protein
MIGSQTFEQGLFTVLCPAQESFSQTTPYCRWKAAKLVLCSALRAYEQGGILIVSHLLWNESPATVTYRSENSSTGWKIVHKQLIITESDAHVWRVRFLYRTVQKIGWWPVTMPQEDWMTIYCYIHPAQDFFSPIWRRHHCWWRAAICGLCSALTDYEKEGIFIVPHMLHKSPAMVTHM